MDATFDTFKIVEFSKIISMSRLTLPEYTAETKADDFLYSYEVDEPVKEGEGKARRSYSSKGPMLLLPPGVTNLQENMLHGVTIAGDRNFLGHRPIVKGVAQPYVWQSYNQVYARIKNLGSALINRGYSPEENVGLFSINRPEWVISEYASFWAGLVTVPLYDTLGDEAIEYIIGKCDIPLIFASADKALVLLKIATKLPTLKTIVVMDQIDDDLKNAARKTKIKTIQLTTLEKEGAQNHAAAVPSRSDGLATISFTSGTTGLPKGVMLTHGNMLSFLTAVLHMIEHNQVYKVTSDDVHLSYLPLAHVLERSIQVLFFYFGSSIGFYQGDTLKLMDDMAVLQPTLFASVPRLYNRIYDRILGNVKATGGIKAALFNYAYEGKKYWLKRGWVKHSLWDRLVFGAVRARLGGRVQFMITGAAPISTEVLDFLRICFSVKLVEGYGQTEGNGATCSTHTTDLEAGHVGPPMPHTMCKLRDVPSMNYYSSDQPFPRGEICFKGASIFKGYYKDEEKTKETLSEDGWCYTGDVGYWDEKGRLHIIDRVKK
ncbi:hypothetical protein HDU91_001274 [Kappamyces sp. JEL0680]|nr:hypothetical protein HDU91_001274 [Kappamyces sp. JEL0680]